MVKVILGARVVPLMFLRKDFVPNKLLHGRRTHDIHARFLIFKKYFKSF